MFSTGKARRRLIFNAFAMNTVSHVGYGLWRHPQDRQIEFDKLELWIEFARILEDARFDAIFFADVPAIYDKHGGTYEAALRHGVQAPTHDPSMLAAMLAARTSNLSFAFTHSILQEPPFNFARRVATLDSLSGGRVGWNIVTSFVNAVSRNLGHGDLADHDVRYDQADEYLEVVYKLWEGSWRDEAFVADRLRSIMVNPEKVRPIDHDGTHYNCAGPFVAKPTRQRTPVLLQAGASSRGRSFAARHAELIFTGAMTPDGMTVAARELREKVATEGRSPDNIVLLQRIDPIVGGTIGEAERKQKEFLEYFSEEGLLTHSSATMGIDLTSIDVDSPIRAISGNAVRGEVKAFLEAQPNQDLTFRQVLMKKAARNLVGTPETIADEIELWARAGAGGFNVAGPLMPGSLRDFAEGVVPVLQKRGLMQTEYREGGLREKIFGQARLDANHPAAAYRW